MSARSRAFPWWGPKFGSPDVPEPRPGDPNALHFFFTSSEPRFEYTWHRDKQGRLYFRDRLAEKRAQK